MLRAASILSRCTMEMNPSLSPSLGPTVISARCKIWCLCSLKHLLLYFILLQLQSVEKNYFKILFQRWGITQYLNSLRKICENAYNSICSYPKEIKAESEKICSFKKKRLMKSIDEKRKCQQATPYGVTLIPSIQAAIELSAWNTYLAAVSDHTELHLTVSCGTYTDFSACCDVSQEENNEWLRPPACWTGPPVQSEVKNSCFPRAVERV